MLSIRALQPLCPGQAPSPRAVATQGPTSRGHPLAESLAGDKDPERANVAATETSQTPHGAELGLSWGWPGLGKAEPSQQAPVSWREALGHCAGHAWPWDGNPGFDRSRG